MSEKKRLGGLDTLRGLAAMYVVAFHLIDFRYYISPIMKQIFDSGTLTLSIFFSLSGFLVCKSYASSIEIEENPKRNFFIRRFFRIVPLWWTVLLLSHFMSGNYSWPVLLANMSFVFGFLSFDESYLPIGAAWSLVTEVVFYLFFPFIFWRAARGLNTLTLFLITFSCAILWNSYAVKMGVPTGQHYIGRFPLANFQYFALGMMIYQIYTHKPTFDQINKLNGNWIFTWLDLITVSVLFLRYFNIVLFDEILVFTCSLGFLLEGTFMNRFLNNKFLQWVGIRCYGIYIIHSLVIVNLGWRMLKMQVTVLPLKNVTLAISLHVAIMLLITMGFAALFYEIIEKPSIRLAEKIIRREGKILFLPIGR